jgi:hypothetical protein
LLLAGVTPVVVRLLFDVATYRERLVAGAGDDEATDRVVGFEQFHRVEQLGTELAVHGVEGLGPVERDDADTVLPLDQDVFVCHRLDPPLAVRALWSRRTVSVLKVNGVSGVNSTCELSLSKPTQV